MIIPEILIKLEQEGALTPSSPPPPPSAKKDSDLDSLSKFIN